MWCWLRSLPLPLPSPLPSYGTFGFNSHSPRVSRVGGNVNKIYEHLWSVPLRCVMILCGDVTFFLVLLPLGLAESLDRRRPCRSAGSSIEYLHWTLLAGNIRSSALSLMYVKNVGLPCLLSRPTAPGRSVCPIACVITVCMCIGRTRR